MHLLQALEALAPPVPRLQQAIERMAGGGQRARHRRDARAVGVHRRACAGRLAAHRQGDDRARQGRSAAAVSESQGHAQDGVCSNSAGLRTGKTTLTTMFTPIKLETRKNVSRFKNMQVGEVRELGAKSRSQAVATLRFRMKKYVHEIYTLDDSSMPFRFRRDA